MELVAGRERESNGSVLDDDRWLVICDWTFSDADSRLPTQD